MATYRVLLPTAGADPGSLGERASFQREGFSWPALLFGPFWLLARGLWRPLGVWCLGAFLVALMLRHGSLSSGGAAWLYLLGVVFLGFEGRSFVGAAIERRGFAPVDVVTGADRIAAERAFFIRWLAAIDVAPSAATRPHIPVAQPQVIGLFPEAGGSK